MLAPYVDNRVLDSVAEHLTQLLNDHLKGKYQGPLGVDMMVVANQNTAADTPSGFFVHPVVEINSAPNHGTWCTLSFKGRAVSAANDAD